MPKQKKGGGLLGLLKRTEEKPTDTQRLLAFYRNESAPVGGRTLDQIRSLSDDDVGRTYDCVQWLFPTHQPSTYNRNAPILTPESVKAFLADAKLQRELKKSVYRWLAFMGLRIETKHGDVTVRREPNWDSRRRVWYTPDNHNFLCISRMLTACRDLGLRAYSMAIYDFFEGLNAEEGVATEKTMRIWRSASGHGGEGSTRKAQPKSTLDAPVADTQISRFLSYALRHEPESVGLTMDRAGWVEVDDLIEGARTQGISLSLNRLERLIERDEEGWFSLSNDKTRIRAKHRHSVQVDIAPTGVEPPELLYLGAAAQQAQTILGKGLPSAGQPIRLAGEPHRALRLGARHEDPVVLEVLARSMVDSGYSFQQSADGWLTDEIPAHYIRSRGKLDKVLPSDTMGTSVDQVPHRSGPYDVFISCASEDYEAAEYLGRYLQSKGKDVFLSSMMLSTLGEADYRKAIAQAIESASNMVVFASRADHAKKVWVEYEWGIFLNEKLAERKAGNLLTVATKACDVNRLPIELRNLEVVVISREGLQKLLGYL
jgi:putative RNA 2'-phosphotransferase